MIFGYMGRILFVNLSTGELKEEIPDSGLYDNFIGGYGIGARILYSRQKPSVDPLGPENILGFISGPLTGTLVPTGARYAVVAKSPLTGGWGDSNCGGHFGPNLKFSGYDAIFFNGVANEPVYLFIDNGKAELRDAKYLWGKSTYETEDSLKAELGEDTEIACIGPAGEKRSLISCIITRRGAAAGRSGLGAVMGSKKLKAVAVRGNQKVPIANEEELFTIRKANIMATRLAKSGPHGTLATFHKYGTTQFTDREAHSGDSPIKNWGGVGVIDLPNVLGLSADAAIANIDKREACWHCPIACQASLKAGMGDYKYPSGTRRPEYETQGSFGGLCLNNDTESIAMANNICNSYGLDTISAGGTIAFAIECYENGLISKNDTGGIELKWGKPRSIIEMTEKMARREGFGDILADGVKVAAEKIGKDAEQYAIHIGGQELGMHDSKAARFDHETGARFPDSARYQMDATPGRHGQLFGPSSFWNHVLNSAGVCFFGNTLSPFPLVEFMQAVTGEDRSISELLKAGERIATMRHVFNLREGINPLEWHVNPRIIGDPPQKVGPLAGLKVDIKAEIYWNLGALDWDQVSTKPSKKKLLELGLDDIANELWPKKNAG